MIRNVDSTLGSSNFSIQHPVELKGGESWTDVTTEVLILAPKNQYSLCWKRWSLGQRTVRRRKSRSFFGGNNMEGKICEKACGIWHMAFGFFGSYPFLVVKRHWHMDKIYVYYIVYI